MTCSNAVWLTLLEAGADATSDESRDIWGQTPTDTARAYGYRVDPSLGLVMDQSLVPGAHTSIITHEMCMRHFTCPPLDVLNNAPTVPPENNRRLAVLLHPESGILHSADLNQGSRVLWDMNPSKASLSDVLRVHEWSYLRTIQHKCEGLNIDPDNEVNGMGLIDSDTTVSHLSFEAALYAAGAVCRGVDAVMKGGSRNAFCPVRPPGHHAGPRGITGSLGPMEGGSHGFCLLNNISIAAAYAMNMYRDAVKRVAIVDFDVHHGNGTEETIRWLQPGMDTLELPSRTGSIGLISTPRYKPWFGEKDTDNVLFVSVHGYGPRERVQLRPEASAYEQHVAMASVGSFYPGTGKTCIPEVYAPRPVEPDCVSTASGFDVASLSSLSKVRGSKNPAGERAVQEEGQGVEGGMEEQDGEEQDGEDAGYGSDGAEGEGDSSFDEEQMLRDYEEYSQSSAGSGSSSASVHDSGLHATKQVMRKISRLQKAYTRVKGSQTSANQNINPQKPLIMDIGVELCPSSGEDDGSSNSALYRHQWRNYFRNEIFPKLMKFKPDMLFISAGFDAHKKDTINSGYISLVEEDYEWVTAHLVRIANSCCEGRVVSALEGGYQIKGEYCSAFAKSVKQHVQALVQGNSSRAQYSAGQLQAELAVEKEAIDRIEQKRIQRLEQEQERYRAMMERHALEQAAESEAAKGYVEGAAEMAAGVADPDTVQPAPAVEEEAQPRSNKRRRANVDYSALAEQLFGGGAADTAADGSNTN